MPTLVPLRSFAHVVSYRTAEHRSQGPPSNNGQFDARGYTSPPQGYQGVQAPPPLQTQTSSRDFDDSKRANYTPQQAYYLTNDNAWAPLSQRYSGVQASDAMSGQQRGYPDDDSPQMLMPPPYANQQQKGFVFPRDRGYENQGRSPSPLPALAGKAMDYAMNAVGSKAGKNGEGKGSDMLAGLFSK